jgi:hypothetical protein
MVTVDSPKSVRLSNRSPRLNNLLLALQGVIELEDENTYSDTEEEPSSEVDDAFLTPGSHLTHRMSTGEPSFISDEGSTLVDEGRDTSSPLQGGHIEKSDEKEDVSRYLRSSTDRWLGEDLLLDNDEQVTIRAPLPHLPATSHVTSQQDKPPASLTPAMVQPHSSIPPTPTGSELSALSCPSELPNFPSTPFSAPHSRQSFSSDDWTSPSPILLSPPRSPPQDPTLDILISPFGSPSQRNTGSFAKAITPAEGNTLTAFPLSDTEINVTTEPFQLDLPADQDRMNSGKTDGGKTTGLEELTPCLTLCDDLSLIAEINFDGSGYSLDDEGIDPDQLLDDKGEKTENKDPPPQFPPNRTIEQADDNDETFFCQGSPHVSDGEVALAIARFEDAPIHHLDSAHVNGAFSADNTIEAESSGSVGDSSGDYSASSSEEKTADVLGQLEDLAAVLNIAAQPTRAVPSLPLETEYVEDRLLGVNSPSQLSPLEQHFTQSPGDTSTNVSDFVTAAERIPVREPTEIFDAGSSFTSNSPDDSFGQSPSPLLNGNDTIHSLYESYSAFASPENTVTILGDKRMSEVSSCGSVQEDICQGFGTPSPPPSSSAVPELSRSDTPSDIFSSPSNTHPIRGRVFTPPLIQGRTETITRSIAAEWSQSLSASPHRLDSPFRTPSPLTASSRGEEAVDATTASTDHRQGPINDVEASKKVPFGFRKIATSVSTVLCN